MATSLKGYGQDNLHGHVDTVHGNFTHNSISIGVGIPYQFQFNGFGLNAKAFYNVGHHLRFGPEFFFLKHDQTNIFDIDLIGYYLFETPWFGTFPIIGGNYTTEWQHGHHQTAYGLTWGFGVHKHFGPYNVFAEFSNVESELGASFISVGLLFTL